MFWIIQAIVLWIVAFLCFIIKNIDSKTKEGNK